MESGEKAHRKISESSGDRQTLPLESGFSEGRNIELDLPPEYCHYRDEGCELAASCLHCPFPRCIYEQPGGRQRWLKRLRDKEMVRLFTTDGKGIKELALRFGVSQRTVQRALGRVENE